MGQNKSEGFTVQSWWQYLGDNDREKQKQKEYINSLPFHIETPKTQNSKTLKRDFCTFCGAHIPAYVGEGTCPACAP